MKQYRIGEFAKFLGVSPDFLKHYEEQGILRPSRSESGYRYYSFTTAMTLIECVRLRNYGMTLREIREILTEHAESNQTVERRFAENIRSLEQELTLDQALIRNYHEFLTWREPLEERDWDWDVRRSSPMLFLPHTDRDDFLPDSRIYEILRDWMSFIPMVKSTMRIDRSGQVTWGFVVSEAEQRELRLPVNDIVERIPARKILYYKFHGELRKLDQEHMDAPDHPAFRLLRALDLKGGDSYFRTTLVPGDWQRDLRLQYGFYAIPISPSPQGLEEAAKKEL